jgi:hypothetical protein
MIEVGFFAGVPEAGIADGRASPGGIFFSEEGTDPAPLRILSGAEPTKEAFVSVPYYGHWFWILDTDIRSKAHSGRYCFCFRFRTWEQRKVRP